MFFRRALVSLLGIGAAYASVIVARTAATVERDIGFISGNTTKLSNAVKAFPSTGGTVLQALAIHTDAVATNTAVQQTLTDSKATPSVSEADATTIIALLQALANAIVDALAATVAKKAAFRALDLQLPGTSKLVGQDLNQLYEPTALVVTAAGLTNKPRRYGSTKLLETDLLSKTPNDKKAQANAIIAQINAAFDKAIAAYSS
ncbi:hypothetical protein EXIGLDRAFT_763076 [Exidia glandulosa HHB12029]|uniref:Hydrophobic surface binding protein n=1 Tax=Exidia glandulosa HHB12029 TaxID=1314781 RepID=A0A165M6N4_EXIGL|nr:hypothetical protein EXIGLDRAFT_763076 [Exidia glandulosa HHB12029]